MARIVKKITLKYQYLKLELEDILDQMTEYENKWSSRFGKYFVPDKVEVWKNTETGETSEKLPENKNTKVEKNKKIKKIYRKLATTLHPDKGGSKDKFNLLKQAYENNDILGLLTLDSVDNLEDEIEEEDINLLNNSIEFLTKRIQEKKMTMVWQYYTGNDEAKKVVLQQIELISGKKIEEKDLVD